MTAPRARHDEVLAFAFDHRNQFFDLAQQTGADESRIPQLKQLFVDAVAEIESARGLRGRVGILCDDRYGQDALNAATGRGWWIGRPVELPGSNPVVFDRGRSIGTTLTSWPLEHVVKCLVQYHPDDAVDNRLEQEAQIRALYDAVQASGHELLLEIIPPKSLPRAPDTVHRAMKRLYNLDIFPEWWKLEPMDATQWQAIDDLIAERDPYCRGVVLLGLNAGIETLAKGFRGCARQRDVPRVRRRPHHVSGALDEVARRRDRRRGAEACDPRQFRGADRRVAGFARADDGGRKLGRMPWGPIGESGSVP